MQKKTLGQIRFHFLLPCGLRERNRLRSFLQKVFKDNGKKAANINYVFCSDAYLGQINRQFLHHNTLTDIITFPFSADKRPVVADVYISVERVRENAKIFNTTFKREIHRVIFHGALHLCGFKDKSKEEALVMRGMEEDCLHNYFVPREK